MDSRRNVSLLVGNFIWESLSQTARAYIRMKHFLFVLMLMFSVRSAFGADSVEEIRGLRTEMNAGFNRQPRNFDFISTRLTENFTLIGPAGRFANPQELAVLCQPNEATAGRNLDTNSRIG
jgi:hypothetical protein